MPLNLAAHLLDLLNLPHLACRLVMQRPNQSGHPGIWRICSCVMLSLPSPYQRNVICIPVPFLRLIHCAAAQALPRCAPPASYQADRAQSKTMPPKPKPTRGAIQESENPLRDFRLERRDIRVANQAQQRACHAGGQRLTQLSRKRVDK